MPLFEFKCVRCGKVEEALFASAKAAEHCVCGCSEPDCYGLMTKIISAPAFSVKGFNAQNGYSSGGGPA